MDKNRCLLLLFSASLLLLSLLPALSVPTGSPQNVQISTSVGYGLQTYYPQTLIQYQESSSTTAQFQGSTTVTIPAASTDNAVTFATLFPAISTPILIGLQDVTNPGQALDIGLSAGGPRLHMAAGGFMEIRSVSGSSTVFYVDNAGSDDAALRIFTLGN